MGPAGEGGSLASFLILRACLVFGPHRVCCGHRDGPSGDVMLMASLPPLPGLLAWLGVGLSVHPSPDIAFPPDDPSASSRTSSPGGASCLAEGLALPAAPHLLPDKAQQLSFGIAFSLLVFSAYPLGLWDLLLQTLGVPWAGPTTEGPLDSIFKIFFYHLKPGDFT